MKQEIRVGVSLKELMDIRKLIDMASNLGVFRSGDVLQKRDEDQLTAIRILGQDIQKYGFTSEQ